MRACFGIAGSQCRGVSTSPPESPAPKVLPGWRRWLLTVLSVLLLLTFLGVAIAYIFGYDFVKYFVESPAGRRIASTSVGRAIKVDGEFAPLHLNGWILTTGSFTSTGWPGEAIGGLNAYGVRVEYDPAAVWDGVWHIKGIQIEHGQFLLRTPNDALKHPVPPKKPRPWYAHFIPSVFKCGPIVTPDANVDFEFQGKYAKIMHAPLQADLIDRDFRYNATGGTLAGFPYLPDLHIDKLKVFVTRYKVTIEDAQLSGLTPADPVRMSLKAELGQRQDKTIKAIIDVTQMPIEQMLPPEVASVVRGRMTGHVSWDRSADGKDIYADGKVDMSGAGITDLSVFKELAVLHGNPDLVNFTFDLLHLKFHLEHGIFTADLDADAEGKFLLTGGISYELATKVASINATFSQLPLKVWMPSDFKPRYDGVATAHLQWHGQLRSVKNSTAAIAINLDNTHINNPPVLRRLLAKTKFRTPDEIDLRTARFNFAYKDEVFQLTNAHIDAPGVITADATGTLGPPDQTLDAVLTWKDLKLTPWLPREIASQIFGDLNGDVKVHVQRWQLKDGSYGGRLELVRGKLEYTSVQSAFARWMKDRALLEIPLTRASLAWAWNGGALIISDLDLRGDDAFGVQGGLMLGADGALSGDLQVGLRQKYVASLMGLGGPVFARDADGLRWAHVKVSGTAKKPKQDLSSQLMAQLPSHPLAVLGLGGRVISWTVGNWFGAAADWKRPAAVPAPNVTAGPLASP